MNNLTLLSVSVYF